MKVGDYVRYRCAYDNTIKIKKINAIVPPDNCIEENYYKIDDYEGTIEKCIIKSSPNIIDLIEVGDILSFEDNSICRIIEITYNGYYLLKDYGGEQYYESKEWLSSFKSIVTKEQFESMKYKVKE